MGDVNLEIKLSNLDERVIKIEESGSGSGGDGYITSVSNDFNVVNKKLSLSNDVTTKLSKIDNKIDKPASATEGQVLTYRNNEWVADDSQGGGSQYVIIVKSEYYEGQTVTATKDTKSKSAVITSGVARIPVDEGGVWTLTLSSGETWNTPNMIYYGEYEVALVPNGSTVTPTNDIQTWLKCADINKSYTTISQVLADTNTLSALISDNNAVDYMVRSTTWASDVCNNESAMTYIGLNDYCANKLLSDSTWSEAICDSPYFEKVLNAKVPVMTSNTKPYGEASASGVFSTYYPYMAFRGIVSSDYGWVVNTKNGWIQYKFINPLHIYKIKISNVSKEPYFDQGIKNFDIQYSDDGINFTTAYSGTANIATSSGEDTNQHFNFNSNGYHKYWRINCKDNYGSSNGIGITDLQFYGREEA